MGITKIALSIFKHLPKGLTQNAGRAALQVRKYSPEILMAVGTVAMGATVYTACKTTLHLDDILEDYNTNKETIRIAEELLSKHKKNGKKIPKDLTEEVIERDRAVNTIQAGVKLAKAYFPSIALAAISLGCFFGAHSIMARRNAALAAAYLTVEEAFDRYRDRVIEKFGKEVDKQFSSDKIEEVVVDEDGNETVFTKRSPSMYARVFDEFNKNFSSEDAMRNKLFLSMQQNYFNDLLASRGHVFLNEVYDALGFDRTQAGSVVGWLLSDDGTDNFVDFGVFDHFVSPEQANFINEVTDAVLLDFNVNGTIYDKI